MATLNGIYLPANGEQNWGTNVTANFTRQAETHFNVKAYGAVGDGSADDTTAIQAAIDACKAAGGGTVYFPGATYKTNSTLTIGAPAGGQIAAIRLAGAGWGHEPTYKASRLVGGGASDYGPVLKIHNAHNIAVENLLFDGGNLATTCVTIEHDSTDTSPPSFATEHLRFQACGFRGARTYNVQINGSAAGINSGNVSLAVFDACFFNHYSGAAATSAHVYSRSPNALSNQFYGCQFYGDGTYPDNGIFMESGRMFFYGCQSITLGTVDIKMIAPANDIPPSISVYGWESQSKRFLLYNATASSAAAVYPTVISGLSHNDIESTGTYSIDWTWSSGNAPLVLQGLVVDNDITITGTGQRTFADGVVFRNSTDDFAGTGRNNIIGSWFSSGQTNPQVGFGAPGFAPHVSDTDGSHWPLRFELDDATSSANEKSIGVSFFENRVSRSALGAIEGYRRNSVADWHGGLNFLINNNVTNAAESDLTRVVKMDNIGVRLPAAGTGVELTENGTTDLAAGATNTARLYCRDNGAGKTQLVVRFNTGAVQVIATEP
jgi:hypothetical protein